jgi:hypothetical protein
MEDSIFIMASSMADTRVLIIAPMASPTSQSSPLRLNKPHLKQSNLILLILDLTNETVEEFPEGMQLAGLLGCSNLVILD